MVHEVDGLVVYPLHSELDRKSTDYVLMRGKPRIRARRTELYAYIQRLLQRRYGDGLQSRRGQRRVLSDCRCGTNPYSFHDSGMTQRQE